MPYTPHARGTNSLHVAVGSHCCSASSSYKLRVVIHLVVFLCSVLYTIVLTLNSSVVIDLACVQ